MSRKKSILGFVAAVCTCCAFWWGFHINVSQSTARLTVANSRHLHTHTFESTITTQNVLAQTRQKPVTPSDQRTAHHSNSPQLSETDIEGVEKFVFFIGYPRSGHSIIGSMMDAHPNMVIAHEYFLFNQWDTAVRNRLKNKTYFFNALYKNSFEDAMNPRGLRNIKDMHKGYTLAMNSTWQGGFTKLRIIGDKSGGQTCIQWNKNAEQMKVYYQELLATLEIPIHVLHVVRNPYDMIATAVLYAALGHKPDTKYPATEDKKYFNPTLLRDKANYILEMANAVEGMVKEMDFNLLQLHNEDFIADPKGTIGRICDFLEVECTEEYLRECYDKAYKVISRSRNLVVWTTEVHEMIEKAMEKHAFFHRYSFQSD